MRKLRLLLIIGWIFVMVVGVSVVEAESIEYVSMWNQGEPAGDYFKQMAKEFEAETGIKVNVTLAGRDVLNKIKARLLMGNPPDLVDQDFNELAAALFRDEILATPISDVYYDEKGPEGQEKIMDLFSEKLAKLYEKEEELYFFPYEYVTSGFFYDKSMFEKNNLVPPETWEEFIKLSRDLKENGIAPLALDGTIQFYNAYYYYWATNRVLGPGSLRKAATDETGKTWDDPGYLKAAEMVYELSKTQKDFFQEGYEGSSWPAAQADWSQGKSGMILCGTWIPIETQKTAKDGFEFGFFPFPAVKGKQGKLTDVEAYLIGFAIPKGAKNPEAAQKFMKFIIKKENAQKLVEMTDNISPRQDIKYPEILSDVKPVVENAESFHKCYDGVLAELPGWFSKVFYPLDNKLIFGTITPEEFIQQIQKETIKYWKTK